MTLHALMIITRTRNNCVINRTAEKIEMFGAFVRNQFDLHENRGR